jgi:hypothetical protein
MRFLTAWGGREGIPKIPWDSDPFGFSPSEKVPRVNRGLA